MIHNLRIFLACLLGYVCTTGTSRQRWRSTRKNRSTFVVPFWSRTTCRCIEETRLSGYHDLYCVVLYIVLCCVVLYCNF